MRYGSVCSGIEAASVAWGPLGWQAAWLSEIEPFPCRVLAARFPAVPNLGDMTLLEDRILSGEVEAPDLLVGGTPCFVAGTLVTARRGLIPIESVQVGEEVLTHERRWRRVLRVGSKNAPTVIVKGQGHNGIETTAEHPFLARKKSRRSTRVAGKPIAIVSTSEPQWINAAKLKGWHWASVAEFPAEPVPAPESLGNEDPPPAIGADLMWLAGAFLGDGWTRISSRRGSVMFGVNDEKAELIEAHASAIGLTLTRTSERTTTRLQLARRSIARWLREHFGMGCDGKRIPVWALGMQAELRQALLNGYMAMDGTQTPFGRRASTVCRELAFGIKMLANSLGYSASLGRIQNTRERFVIEGRTVNERPYFTVTATESNRTSFEMYGLRFGLVRSVTETGRVERVFNLEVEEDNSYVADGLVVHNCQAFSVAGLRGSLSDARGNLALVFVRLANAIDTVRAAAGKPPCFVLWENVPGVLSTKDNAFGHLLGGLVGADSALAPRGGWTDAGVVSGPRRVAAWRTLDAQYFGVAQRRRRVFVLARGGAGAWACADALLPIGPRGEGDFEPRRTTRKEAAGDPAASPVISSGRGWWSESDVGATLRAQDSITKSDTLLPEISKCLTTGEGGAPRR